MFSPVFTSSHSYRKAPLTVITITGHIATATVPSVAVGKVIEAEGSNAARHFAINNTA
jgi:hypothetical protein